MLQAIVYKSNTGTTEKYAKLLSERLDLPALSLAEAEKQLAAGAEIIYMGWLMASAIQGYKAAAQRFQCGAVCGVGMGANGSQIKEAREKNKIDDNIPVFVLQGGFHLSKLSGIYKLMMIVMQKTAGKALAKKADKTAEEEDMLDLMVNGGDRVSAENLSEILSWYERQKNRNN